ncbi:hypothetical protein OKA04_22205 [Luteolibacter flavescens]|uniref:Uncharacterized protein n=1 Tax=Luteolibacter flavescens TaxID=1859460 RepID=A0ABT3FV56_9BACT|nr:hypothetical protein [Luteolibacter flavescens]MCW1887465.1 hypothetical protein [Luteolibacter flavescens]
MTCLFNPFGSADHREQFFDLEAKILSQLSKRLMADLPPSKVRELTNFLSECDDFTAQSLLGWHLIGEGRLAKWKADGFAADWKNDEAVMLRYYGTLRPVLLEFREVLDHQTCVAIDLLRPELPPFHVIDEECAARMGRFDVELAWAYEIPTGLRMCPDTAPMPSTGVVEPADAFAMLLAHLGAPEEDGRDLWLMEHMPLLEEAFRAIANARRNPADRYDLDVVPDSLRPNGDEWDYSGEILTDHPQPALDGKSPREAANDPALRPRLTSLLKEVIRSGDRLRRTAGMDIDFNLLLAELRLEELIFPPPPLGVLEESEDPDWDDEIPLDPPPSQEMLEGEELNRRLQAATGDEALWNRLEVRLADILDAFNDLSEKLNDHELAILQSTALAALGALHPDQPPGYEPDPERMLARYESWIKSGSDDETLADYLDRIFAETRQPALCESAADMLMFTEKQAGKKLRPKKLDAIFTALTAAIWEAAHWPPVLR